MGFRLKSGQSVSSEVRRIVLRQLDLAASELVSVGDPESDEAVHDARRRVKKIRAIIRLVQPVLDKPFRSDPDLKRQRKVVDAFLAAARNGDFEALVAVLDPDVVFRADRGRIAAAGAPPVVTGAAAVAEQILARAPRFARFARPAIVNGTAGLIVVPRERPIAVLGFTIAGGRIVELDLVADPDKLGG